MNVSKFPAASSRELSTAPLGFVDQAREILISLMDPPTLSHLTIQKMDF